MIMHKVSLMALVLAWMVGAIAWGQAQAPPATQPAGNATPMERIATFITEDSVSVIKLDLPKADLKAAEDWLKGFIEAAEPDPQLRQTQINSLHQQAQAVQTWAGNMRQAGVTDVYAIFNRQARPAQGEQAGQGQQEEVLAATIVIPLKPGDQAQQIQDLLLPKNQPNVEAPGQQPGTAVIREAVVLAPQATLDRLQQPGKGDFQTLQRAMASVEGSAIELALMPSDKMKQAAGGLVEQVGANLPQGVTQDDLKTLWQDPQWAAVGLDTPPRQALKVVVQASNPQAAQSMSATVDKLLNAAKQNKEWAGRMPNLEQAMNLLKPTAVGDRLTMTLNPQQMDQLFKESVAAAVRNARSEQPIRAGEMPQEQQPRR
ncbi:MAG TPA: hypothetical protein VHP11_09945 [Tepidisphaeraceae bacterium]|nr:hypothetical protein [Tepidisphaeraceae bacterium]